jgi:hypothetical protein
VLLYTKKRHRTVEYGQGDYISFQLKSDKQRRTEQIRGFQDSLIVFKDYTIRPEEISRLYIDEKTKNWYFLRFKYERLFTIAGAGFFLLDLVNTEEISGETVVISSALVAAGITARLLIPRSVKLSGRRKLTIIRK